MKNNKTIGIFGPSAILMLGMVLPGFSSSQTQNNDGELGPTSTGHINITLEINEHVVAGFLQSNLDNPRSEFRNFLSTQLVQRLQEDRTTTLPFCVLSNGGAYYEIASYDVARGENNHLVSDTGDTLPFYVVIGESEESVAKYKAISDVCDARSAIPVTIRLDQSVDDEDIESIHGKFNLLVKSE